MKRLLSVVLSVCLACAMGLFTGCDNKSVSNDDENKTPDVKTYNLSVLNGTGSGTYEEGKKVTITAEEKEDYIFAGWKIGANIVTENPYLLDVKANTTVEATYEYTYSVWDGTYPEKQPESYVVNEEEKTININDANALAWWRGLCVATSKVEYYQGFKGSTFDNTNGVWYEEDDVNYVAGYTININSNIDLDSQVWKGIDAEVGMFDGCILDGKGHTIKGLNVVSQGLIEGDDSIRGWGTGGFFNMIGSNQKFIIQNINFKNAQVIGTTGQMGVVIGGAYRANVVLNNINIINSTINSANGHKTGALIGRVGNCGDGSGDHERLTITNCVVKDTTIVGMRNIGGLVGAIFSSTDTINRDSYYKATYGA